jgi:hypothetical protein
MLCGALHAPEVTETLEKREKAPEEEKAPEAEAVPPAGHVAGLADGRRRRGRTTSRTRRRSGIGI